MKKAQNLVAYLIIFILVIILVVGFIMITKKPEQLIGGCAGVALEYLQECCDNWAKENNFVKIQCVGEWEIEENKCSWICLNEECNLNSDCPEIQCVKAPCYQYACIDKNCKQFCGSSTHAVCSSDSDCKKGGCSSQVCEGKNENTITTCEYSKCFNSEIFNLKCGCFEDNCQWN